ncbi:uncharacterized protein [Blastocystis hominis]|uniref:DNA helicase n=1 Tax=Blastocystis hominis TaxID=12968 RepID=D8LXS0_BLAHO|nr:uncharacterized protein [Blastocystis hominis]CBK20375.2 unnamed protein product [Blastocystis hominis]|eukprot:XP_012894423.1 uncharacterized protein [Blastocystis hominis]
MTAAVMIVTAINGVVNSHLRVRILDFDPLTPFKDIKANLVGRLVAIQGTIIRVGGIRSMVMKMNFECVQCSAVMQTFVDGKYQVPSRCGNHGCRSQTFRPQRQSAITQDWQVINRLQEVGETDAVDSGRIPRTLEVHLLGDLVDDVTPGELVTITGVVKTMTVEKPFGNRSSSKSSLFLLYVSANSISVKRNEMNNSSFDRFSELDMKAFNFIASQPNLFNLLVHSVCPSIYGQELVKAGILLCLAGGVSMENRRGNIHVLMVGDPGLGKSQLLRAASALSPRGVFVCGNTASGSGLTVTMAKDKITGDSCLEAGALVLSDGGLCCIDEFDKMGGEKQVLLEAMEQQTVSIAKAGIVCTLSSRVSILAAANPSGGHYNRGKTVSENIKMPPGLLSRFDLTFLLLDTPDEEKDRMLSEHIMKMYAADGEAVDSLAHAAAAPSFSMQDDSSISLRLRRGAADVTDPIPAVLLRKYLAFVHQTVNPRLTSEAARVLKSFYLSLRDQYGDDEAIPITMRHLESLVRLSQARARLECRTEVSVEDAKDIIDIMKESLFEVLSDEMGMVDFQRTTGMSKTKQVKLFVAALTKEAERRSNALFSVREMMEVASRNRIFVEDFMDFVDVLNQQAFILKKGGQMYQVQTSRYSQMR